MSVTAPKKKPSKQIDLHQLAEKITSNIAVGVYIVQQGKFVYISPVYSNLTGYSDSELLGKNSLERVHPEDREMVRKKAIKCLKGETSDSYEYRYIKKNDKIMWILEMLTSIKYKGKRAALGSFMDITGRKKMEEELGQSEERYRTIIEEIEEGYYETDLDGNFTFVSDAICATLGYIREELTGLNYKAYIPEDQIKSVYKIFRQSYQTGNVIKWHPLINIRKDGTRIAVEDSIAPLRDKEGKIIGFRGITRDITQRKMMEEALQKSEDYFKEITENSSDVIIITDKHGNIKYCSRSIERFSGYKPEELIGNSAFSFIHADDLQRAASDYDKAIQAKDSSIPNEFRLVLKDGSVRLFEGLGKNLLDNPSVAGFIMNIRDITERRQMEEAIRLSEEKYRTILEDMEDGYFETDLDGNFTFVNDAECRKTGYSREELLRINHRQIQDKKTAHKTRQIITELYKTGERIQIVDLEIIRKDGAKVFNEASISLIRDTKGKPIGFRGISRDVTNRRQMEETIRRSEEKYRTILKNMQEAYFEVDLAGTLTFVNEALCENLRFTKEELIGMNFSQFADETNARELYQVYNKIYRTGDPVKTADFEFTRKDGTKLFAESSASIMRDADGKIIGFSGVSRDVTERKQMEETIRQSEERYRTIIEEMEEWYLETDLAGNLLFFNEALARALKYSKKELSGMNFRSFMRQEQAEEIFKAFHSVYETGNPIKNYPYKFIWPDGVIAYTELSVFPKLDRENKVFGFRAVGHEITERKKAEEQLNYIATHDPLTNLPNRMLLLDRLKMAMAQAKRNDQKLAVMMLDLDHFKDVNDTLGHMLGDELLKEIGVRLTGRLRQNDTISRLGGDEFIILLPAIESAEDAVEVAKIVLESFEQPFICNGHTITTSISIGIAIYPDDCQDMDSLLKNADIAMYYVKAHGRNGYHLFTQINFNHIDQRIQ